MAIKIPSIVQQATQAQPITSLADKLAAIKRDREMPPAVPAVPAVPSSNKQSVAFESSNTEIEQNSQANQDSRVNANILARLAALQDDLVTGNPGISDNLRLIHRALLDDPEQVTLLTNEQRAIFFRGLSKQTGVVLTAVAAKSRKKLDVASMTVDDLL